MSRERRALEVVRRWRQAAVWAPVLWIPFVLYGLLANALLISFAIGLAAIFFWALCRAVVRFGRCPRCEARWGRRPEVFQRVWDEASCLDCGISLFELRRAEGKAKQR